MTTIAYEIPASGRVQVTIHDLHGAVVKDLEGLTFSEADVRGSSLNGGTMTLIHIEDTAGNNLVTFRPDYRYSSFLFSGAGIAQGTTYRVYTGGSCTGTLEDGLYTGGAYSGGTLRATISANGGVQTVNF